MNNLHSEWVNPSVSPSFGFARKDDKSLVLRFVQADLKNGSLLVAEIPATLIEMTDVEEVPA